MYHVISAPPAGAPFPGLYVTPGEFAAQMRALKGAGWHAVTLDEVQAYWRRGASLGAGKPIVLTFDNGYQSQYTQALPVLRQLGWVADENIQLTGLPPSQGGLGPAEVRGMLAAGWELDTQGISHADLITLDPQQLHDQVAVARTMLQHRYHVAVNWFCYPSGHYDAAVIAAVQRRGLPRLDDRRARLGAYHRRSLSPSPPARPRRHRPPAAAVADRRHARGPPRSTVLSKRLSALRDAARGGRATTQTATRWPPR